MNVIETTIPGVLIVEPRLLHDARGFFMELYQADRYAKSAIAQSFVQDNLSRSARDSDGLTLAQLAGRLPRYEPA